MKKLWQVGSLKGGVQAVIIGSSRVIALVTFVAYVGAGGNMSAEKVFKVIPLYIPLQINMMVYLPWAVQFLAESVVGIRRLQARVTLTELYQAGLPYRKQDLCDIKLFLCCRTFSCSRSLKRT